jgi:hypothetical protein
MFFVSIWGKLKKKFSLFQKRGEGVEKFLLETSLKEALLQFKFFQGNKNDFEVKVITSYPSQEAPSRLVRMKRSESKRMLDLWLGKDLIQIHPDSPSSVVFLFQHQSLYHQFELLKTQALTQISGQRTDLLMQESRALEWLKVSLKVLTKALENLPLRPELLCEGEFIFQTQNPLMMRIRVFNLDMQLTKTKEGAFHVIVFDDKKGERGSAQTPSLEALFVVLRPQVLDELIKITALILNTFESCFEQYKKVEAPR